MMHSESRIAKENFVDEIMRIYCIKQAEIISRLSEFRKIWIEGKEEDIFAELIFCILTPQSKAKSCWSAVKKILNGLLLHSDADRISRELNVVRFRNKKAEYITEATNLFMINDGLSIKSKIKQFNDVRDAREWLVKNVKGIGYKEASHFLRNIGLGENLVILDRHILKILKLLGVIERIPDSLTRKRYFEIENRMLKFATRINVPISHLDLLLWYKETGEIFK